MGCRGDSVPLRFTPAPPTVRLVHFVNGQPAGPSPYTCPGVDKPPGTPHPSLNASGGHFFFRIWDCNSHRLSRDRLLKRLNTRVFAQVMCQRNEPKLEFDLIVSFKSEALEAMIVFDVSKDRFRLNGTHTSMVETFLAGEQFLRPFSILVVLVVYLYHPIAFRLMT